MKKILKLFNRILIILIVVYIFLINYTFDLDSTGISRHKIDIEWHSDDYDLTIVKKGIPIMFVPPTYGPSYFKIHINKGPIFKIGNWPTNVWHIPNYDIKLTKNFDKYILEFTSKEWYTKEISHYNLKGQLIDTTKSYYNNGRLKYLISYKNGELNGRAIQYLPNGKIDKICIYKNGELIKEKSFVKDTIGDIIFITNHYNK